MSFAVYVKAELARIWPEKACCRQAELAGLVAFAGCLEEKENGPYLVLRTGQAAVARLLYRLLRAGLDVRPKVDTGTHRYYLLAPLTPVLLQWLDRRPGLLDRNQRLSQRQLRRVGLGGSCCRRAFLRGAFLVAGSVSNPRAGYHLEISLPGAAWGHNLALLLLPFKLQPHLAERRGGTILYFKDGEQVARFLNVIEAHAALLDFESARVYREVRNRVNRLVNCDTANLNRTVEASMRQVASICRLGNFIDLAELPPGLREVAALRLQYPDATLRELGQMLKPRVGKAAVSYRLRRLEELAAQLAKERAGGAPL